MKGAPPLTPRHPPRVGATETPAGDCGRPPRRVAGVSTMRPPTHAQIIAYDGISLGRAPFEGGAASHRRRSKGSSPLDFHHRIASRPRFARYLRRRRGEETSEDGPRRAPAESAPPHRPLAQLTRELFRILEGQRLAIGLALATLSVATFVKLVPPAATKLVIDHVLLGRPLPSSFPGWVWVLPGPKGRLILLVAAVLVVSVVGTAFGLWGRWQATRTTKRVQVAMRRRVFEHAARLPLHRVYQLTVGRSCQLAPRGCRGRRRAGLQHVLQPLACRRAARRGGLRSWPGWTGGSCSARSACCRWRSVRSVSGTGGSARFSATSASSGRRSTP